MKEMRNNPNVTNKQLSILLGISETTVEKKYQVVERKWNG